MFDYALVAIAGLAVFGQSLLGLLVTTRPPAEERRKFYEIGFAAVGLVGLVAVIIGGIRTVQTSSHIETGITTIGVESASTRAKLAQQTSEIDGQRKAIDKLADENGQLLGQKAELDGDIRKIASAVGLHGNASVDTIISEVLKKVPSGIWHLTKGQEARLKATFSAVPPSNRFPIQILESLGSTASQTFGTDLYFKLRDMGWDARSGMEITMNPNLVGVAVMIPPNVKDQDISTQARTIFQLLAASGIKPKYVKSGTDFKFPPEQFVISIGSHA
jgi:hypothetical protein